MIMFRPDDFIASRPADRPSGFVLNDHFARSSSAAFVKDEARFSKTSFEQDDTELDPISLARSESYALGFEEGKAAQAQEADQEAAVLHRIHFRLGQIDDQLRDELIERLRETALQICEASLEPLSIDPALLERRVRRALAMLSRADDQPRLFVHPDDLNIVKAFVPTDQPAVADPLLERGDIRVESASGGVEDGPQSWRRALNEALQQC